LKNQARLVSLFEAAMLILTTLKHPSKSDAIYKPAWAGNALMFLGREGTVNFFGCKKKGSKGSPQASTQISREVFLSNFQIQVIDGVLQPDTKSPFYPDQFVGILVDEQMLKSAIISERIFLTEIVELARTSHTSSGIDLAEKPRSAEMKPLELQQIYKDYIAGLKANGMRSTEKQDIEYMERFASRKRDAIRSLRREFAPEHWKKAGRPAKK
jgi:hypothetical protein